MLRQFLNSLGDRRIERLRDPSHTTALTRTRAIRSMEVE